MVSLNESTAGQGVIKVAITGPESTAKSTIAEQLAEHFHTVWVPEYARTYIAGLDRPYTLNDIEAIARGQMALEDEYARKANKLLFCDTDLTVIKIWCEHAFKHCPEWISAELKLRDYDIFLLMNIDNPWRPDPQREHPHLREYFYKLYKQELMRQGRKFVEISGMGEARLNRAVKAVERLYY